MKRRNHSRYMAMIYPMMYWDRSLTTIAFILLSIVLLMMSIFNPDSVASIRSGAMNSLSPIVSAISAPVQFVSQFVRDVSGLSQLQARNALLETENARLKEWYQTALLLEAENKSLKDLLNLKQEPGHKYVSARVISDAGNSFVKTIMIKSGKADEVDKGHVALSSNGLIGRVVESADEAARILLLTDINSRVPVIVQGSNQHAVMAGDNTSTPNLRYLPSDTTIADGARIVTSGNGGIFPAGLPIGITQIDSNGKINVKLYADFNHLQYVRIMSPDNTNLISVP